MRLNFTLLTTFLMSCNALFSQSIANPDAYLPIASFNATPSGGTYTIPATNSVRGTAITAVLIRVWGGGGGGKSSGTNKNGGGGGGFLEFIIPSSQLSSNKTISVTIGSGGGAGSGGVSTVVSHTVSGTTYTFTAGGGNSNGNAGTNTLSPSITGSVYATAPQYIKNYSGGAGSSPSGNGAGGGSGKLGAVGGSASGSTGGSGEKAGFGTGGNGGSSPQSGTFPGGGGGGNSAGARGAVYIYDFSTAALPVSLTNFTAKPTVDNKVNLSWVTASESNNKGFSIERQAEGENKFSRLGFVSSKAEGGNSQSTISYNFKDVTATTGTNTYRLIQEDLDGKQTISEVKMVRLNGQSVVSVYPNPTNGTVTINRSNDGKKMNVQILDQMGRIVSQYQNISDSSLRLNLPQSGIYQIKLMYPETGEQSIQRIVVQH
jgi:hypothetical protein